MDGWSHGRKDIARLAASGARRTEEAYVGWIRRFILANGKRHPRDLGKREVAGCALRPARI